jgi:hypothetical protein
MDGRKSYLDIESINPLYQGFFTVLLVSCCALYCFIFNHTSMQAWNMVLSPIFLFCSYNPIIGVFHKNWWRYTLYSFLVLLGVSFYIYISGNFISVCSYGNTEELQRLTALVFIFYFLLNLISIVFKAILYLLKHIDD